MQPMPVGLISRVGFQLGQHLAAKSGTKMILSFGRRMHAAWRTRLVGTSDPKRIPDLRLSGLSMP